MRTPQYFCFIFAAAASAVAVGQSFKYELLDISNEPARLLAKGSIDIKSKLAITASAERIGSSNMKRELGLPGGWAVGCSDYREPTPKGFGCWLSRRPTQVSLDQYDGFSWEWYDLQTGNTYVKRQGGARLTLKQGLDNGLPMIESLEFQDDTVFTANVGPLKPGKDTHELRIQSGSILPLR